MCTTFSLIFSHEFYQDADFLSGNLKNTLAIRSRLHHLAWMPSGCSEDALISTRPLARSVSVDARSKSNDAKDNA